MQNINDMMEGALSSQADWPKFPQFPPSPPENPQDADAPVPTNFNNLSVEMKEKIYGFFKEVPTASDDDDDEGLEAKQIKKTRKSLLLVSRSVHQEWAPLFFATTTVRIQPPGSRVNSIHEFLFNAMFQDEFVMKADAWKLQLVKKLHYQVQVDMRPEKRMMHNYLACLADLAVVLQTTRHRFPLLEEVSFTVAHLRLPFLRERSDDTYYSRILDGFTAFLHPARPINQAMERMIAPAPHAELSGWSVSRRATFIPRVEDGKLKGYVCLDLCFRSQAVSATPPAPAAAITTIATQQGP